jgi:hypothetical protein
MSASVRVLSISDDDGLRFSRELLLASDGYETESITSNTALSVTRARSFEIAVICRSVEPERAIALADLLRRYNPEIRILTIRQLETQPQHCDADIEIASGPEPVLEACRKLCMEISARGCC